MSALSGLRCFNHGHREAAAQCLSCGRYYCRECVTEHGGRITCAACLKTMTDEARPTRSLRHLILRPLLAVGSLLFLWLVFIFIGRLLFMLPDTFHQTPNEHVLFQSHPEDQ